MWVGHGIGDSRWMDSCALDRRRRLLRPTAPLRRAAGHGRRARDRGDAAAGPPARAARPPGRRAADPGARDAGRLLTLWLARALPEGGRLITLEADPGFAAISRANLAGVDGVELIEGPALETLPGLEPEPFDLIFIDADKAAYPEYLGWALRLSRPGTLIVADNVVRAGAVVDSDSDDPNVRGVRRLTELVAAEPRLTATAVQTVGGKGYDGFLLALVS